MLAQVYCMCKKIIVGILAHVFVHANLIVLHAIHIKNGIMINASTSVLYVQKDYCWNLSTCICEKVLLLIFQ